jgi:hypothetical protein
MGKALIAALLSPAPDELYQQLLYFQRGGFHGVGGKPLQHALTCDLERVAGNSGNAGYKTYSMPI